MCKMFGPTVNPVLHLVYAEAKDLQLKAGFFFPPHTEAGRFKSIQEETDCELHHLG